MFFALRTNPKFSANFSIFLSFSFCWKFIILRQCCCVPFFQCFHAINSISVILEFFETTKKLKFIVLVDVDAEESFDSYFFLVVDRFWKSVRRLFVCIVSLTKQANKQTNTTTTTTTRVSISIEKMCWLESVGFYLANWKSNSISSMMVEASSASRRIRFSL